MKTMRSGRIIALLGPCCGLLLWGCAGGGGGGGAADGVPDGLNDNAEDDDGAGGEAAAERQDLWATDTASASQQDFSARPIPAGFFDFDGRSCESFGGTADFVGAALNESITGAAVAGLVGDRFALGQASARPTAP